MSPPLLVTPPLVQWAWVQESDGDVERADDGVIGRSTCDWSERRGIEDTLSELAGYHVPDQAGRSLRVKIEETLEFADITSAIRTLQERDASHAIAADRPKKRRRLHTSQLCINPSQLVADDTGNVQDFYDVGKLLGKGGYGTVHEATSKTIKSQRVFALKSIAKHIALQVGMKEEISIMKSLDHPNIVKLFHTFQDHRCVYLAMEMCGGGELFDRIIQAGTFSEHQAAIVMLQVLRAVHYLHTRAIIHRDLKPENFLFKTNEPIENNVVKVIDFGLSRRFAPGQVFTELAGSAAYMAPEVIVGQYGPEVDLWSCGVITYILFCGKPLFWGRNDSQVKNMIRNFKSADLTGGVWAQVTNDAKQVIWALLKTDPKDRDKAEEVLRRPWLIDRTSARRGEAEQLPISILTNLRAFRWQHNLKKLVLPVIVRHLSEDQIAGLREAFIELDTNFDGVLTVAELGAGLKKYTRCASQELVELATELDTDHSGVVDYSEFLAAALDSRLHYEEDACWAAFRVFDLDGDGKITRAELTKMLNMGNLDETMGQEVVAQLIREVDSNGDGAIDFEEFMRMMKSEGEEAADGEEI